MYLQTSSLDAPACSGSRPNRPYGPRPSTAPPSPGRSTLQQPQDVADHARSGGRWPHRDLGAGDRTPHLEVEHMDTLPAGAGENPPDERNAIGRLVEPVVRRHQAPLERERSGRTVDRAADGDAELPAARACALDREHTAPLSELGAQPIELDALLARERARDPGERDERCHAREDRRAGQREAPDVEMA